jgi:ABC-type nickel/cobalt efflux system permease component RcnA
VRGSSWKTLLGYLALPLLLARILVPLVVVLLVGVDGARDFRNYLRNAEWFTVVSLVLIALLFGWTAFSLLRQRRRRQRERKHVDRVS